MDKRLFVVFASWNNGFPPSTDISIDALAVQAYFRDESLGCTVLSLDRDGGTFRVLETTEMVKLKLETAWKLAKEPTGG